MVKLPLMCCVEDGHLDLNRPPADGDRARGLDHQPDTEHPSCLATILAGGAGGRAVVR